MMSDLFKAAYPSDNRTPHAQDWLRAVGLTLALLGGMGQMTNAPAAEVSVPMNLPSTLTSDVIPGAKETDITFTLDQADGVMLEVIAPVDGASFSLIDPNGTTLLASSVTGVEFISGADLAPGKNLPGGIFTTEEVSAPSDGTWTIHLSYPEATQTTVIMANVYVRTAYQAGIAVTRETYLTGESASIGMLVLNGGIPVTGVTPQISISLVDSSNAADTAHGLDDGQEADGLADDGVYSRDFTFNLAGEYLVEGSVEIPTASGTITRTANRILTVTDPPLTVSSVTTNTILGTGGCVKAINEVLDLNVVTTGEYVVQGTLSSPSGHTLTERKRGDFTSGAGSIALTFSGDDIIKSLAENGPYILSSLDVLSLSDSGITLASRNIDLSQTTAIDLGTICKDPIVISASLTVNPQRVDNYIGALEFVVPVYVQAAGNYQMSFKVVGSGGVDISLAAFSRYLNAGMNNVSFSLDSSLFQAADGPYSVISALAVGNGNTAQLSLVGSTPDYQRWQFLPSLAGDLDADGDVDSTDRAILLGARNNPALSPGDRRDLVRDGIIDLRDARAILLLQ